MRCLHCNSPYSRRVETVVDARSVGRRARGEIWRVAACTGLALFCTAATQTLLGKRATDVGERLPASITHEAKLKNYHTKADSLFRERVAPGQRSSSVIRAHRSNFWGGGRWVEKCKDLPVISEQTSSNISGRSRLPARCGKLRKFVTNCTSCVTSVTTHFEHL